MCTLSFVPTDGGFLLAMNRDEQRTRAKALPPQFHRCGSLKAMYPSEPGGGTWIGINSLGLCAALINWYSRPQYPGDPDFSRGGIIPRLLACDNREKMEQCLYSLPLDRLNPFRIFVFGIGSGDIREYRSDGVAARRTDHAWSTNHWFSSGHNETTATTARRAACLKASLESDAGSLGWIDRLHSSHDPVAGADSICVHREDAVTVSITLIRMDHGGTRMEYRDGSPCESLAKGSNSECPKISQKHLPMTAQIEKTS